MSEFLYHYTTISNLALILKNRTLRLNSLDNMDDLQEAKSKDIQDYGKFVYVSCWTDMEKEIIPMWKMYTKPQAGVRITLPKNPFQIIDDIQTNHYRDPTIQEIKNSMDIANTGMYPIIGLMDMLTNGFIIPNISLNQQLKSVIYTDDKEKLEPQILTIKNEKFDADVSKIGIIKNRYWEFQHEWRYVLRAVPFSIANSFKNHDAEMRNFQNSLMSGTAKQPISYIDLHLSNSALEQMQIILAPDITTANEIIVKSLVEKYNPRATILHSQLKGLVR